MAAPAMVDLHQKRDIGEVINATFSFLRLTYKSMYKDLLFIAGPFFILGGIFSALTQYSTLFAGLQQNGPFSSLSSPEYYLSLACILIGWSIVYAISGNHVLQYSINKGPGYDTQQVRDSLRGDFMRMLLANFIAVLAIAGGFILLVIPGIYLAVANSLVAIIIILNKNVGIGQAFAESRRLVKDNWWRTLGLLFIMAFIIGGINMIFSIPALVFSAIIAFHSARGGDIEHYRLIYIILMAVAQLGSALTSPISIVASSIYYYSLKESKDQVSLLEKIDNIGAQQSEIKKDEGSY